MIWRPTYALNAAYFDKPCRLSTGILLRPRNPPANRLIPARASVQNPVRSRSLGSSPLVVLLPFLAGQRLGLTLGLESGASKRAVGGWLGEVRNAWPYNPSSPPAHGQAPRGRLSPRPRPKKKLVPLVAGEDAREATLGGHDGGVFGSGEAAGAGGPITVSSSFCITITQDQVRIWQKDRGRK